MSVELHFNHQRSSVNPGASLFAGAEALGINVPTSCRKQGKCKECVVEITEGMELLSERVAAEKHLKGNFRLSCCCRIVKDSGVVRCHTMRRGNLRIERHAFNLPVRAQVWKLDPAATRNGGRILLDGVEIDRSAGPIHGLAMDLGTTTVVLRLLNLETGEVVADASFENPQRFGGSDVMARIHYDTEDGTHLLQRTLAGYLTRAIEEFPADPKSIYEMVVAGNSTMRDLFFRLNVESSKRIGLVPDLAEAKIRQVGNAAIEGACIALLSRAKRAELEDPVKRVVHCRLEAHPRFFDCFVEGCQFRPVEFSNRPRGSTP